MKPWFYSSAMLGYNYQCSGGINAGVCACDTTNWYMTWTFIRVLVVHWMSLPRCYRCSTYDGATVRPHSPCLHRQCLKHIPGKQAERQWNSRIDTAWTSRHGLRKWRESRTGWTDGTETEQIQDSEWVCCVEGQEDRLHHIFPIQVPTILMRNKDSSRSSVPYLECVRHLHGISRCIWLQEKHLLQQPQKQIWWLQQFYFLLDAAAYNAYIL